MKITQPKGVLIPIGGREDKEDNKDILARVIKETGHRHPKICLVALATNYPLEVAQDYRLAFRDLGVKNMSVIYFDLRTEADNERHLEEVKHCHAVMFSGGDQLKLSSLLGGTRLLSIIKNRYYDEPGFVVAGTSAGAAAMSNTMIISGSSLDAMQKGELELTNGLDLINSVFIDTHFTERGRLGRLVQTVTCNPGILGLGLGENTGAVIYKGNELEVIGSGLAVILDGTSISYTNLTEVHDKELITVEGIRMHLIGSGQKFLIEERKLKLLEKKKAVVKKSK